MPDSKKPMGVTAEEMGDALKEAGKKLAWIAKYMELAPQVHDLLEENPEGVVISYMDGDLVLTSLRELI